MRRMCLRMSCGVRSIALPSRFNNAAINLACITLDKPRSATLAIRCVANSDACSLDRLCTASPQPSTPRSCPSPTPSPA
eukprot:701736-Rhodomonas_salina.2